jgi:peptidoglycan hydrolase CwlO-like protein
MNPWLYLRTRLDLAFVRLVVKHQLAESNIMATLAELTTSVDALETSVGNVAALCDSLKTQFDALKASHGATPEELGALQARIDALTSSGAATVARDTPA